MSNRAQNASMSEMSCSMTGSMGYFYPIMQGHIYSILQAGRQGYICPMEMKFIDALKLAMEKTGLATSLREVAIQTGVSYDILKNINQGKSEKPNAAAATKIADFFGVSLSDFYAGRFPDKPSEASVELARDVAQITRSVSALSEENRHRVQAFAEALRLTEEDPPQTE